MKVTLLDLFSPSGQLVINKLGESKEADIQTTRMAIRLLKAVKEYNDELQAIITKLNEKYAGKVEESVEEINREITDELSKIEIELDVQQLTIEQLHQAGLNGKEILVVDWLLSDN